MTNFNIAAYIPLALRTEAPLPTVLERLNHAQLGLITETGEFTTEIKRIVIYGKSLDDLAKDGKTTLRQHIGEEIGDTLWYIAIAADALQFTPQIAAKPYDYLALDRNLLLVASFASACTIGGISDTLLRAGAYPEQALSISEVAGVKLKVSDLLTTLSILAHLIGIPLQQIADENIAKLAKRYPDKFSAEAAEARADKGGADARNS